MTITILTIIGLNALHIVVCVKYNLSFTVPLLAGHTLLATKICIIFPDCSSQTRMQSSRMRTARSCSHQLGGGKGGLPQCILGYPPPPRCGPRDPPWLWAWRPPQVRPLNFPPGCGPGDPPQARPLNFPPGCGPGDLQGIVGYTPPQTPTARHAGILTPSPREWND